MKTVAINLLTFNSMRFAEKCLASLACQTYPEIELLIIDNASGDGSPESIQRMIGKMNFKFPVRLIKNADNRGFSGGHNQAIRESGGELVVCLNQDVILAPDFVEQAVEFFKRMDDRKIAVLQPKLRRLGSNLDKTDIIDTTGLLMLKNRRIVSRGQGEKDAGQYDHQEEVFGADGAAPVYVREALEDAKILNEYFDESFFAYKEDVDLSWRLRLFGWKAYYSPKVLAWHGRGAGDSAATNYFSILRERRKISKFAKYVAFKNQRLMQIKNEQLDLLVRHFPRFIVKEISSWVYVILFERFTWKAIGDLFRQAPLAWEKRKLIMARTKVSSAEIGKWFR